MIDLTELIEMSNEYEQVKQASLVVSPRADVELCVDLTIRGKIKLYDDECQERLITRRPEWSDVLSNLENYEQERRFFVYSEFVTAERHSADGAFVNPFCDIGPISYGVNRAIWSGDTRLLLNILVSDVSTFYLSDAVLCDRFIDWVKTKN